MVVSERGVGVVEGLIIFRVGVVILVLICLVEFLFGGVGVFCVEFGLFVLGLLVGCWIVGVGVIDFFRGVGVLGFNLILVLFFVGVGVGVGVFDIIGKGLIGVF